MKNQIKFATTALFAALLGVLASNDAKSDVGGNVAGTQAVYGNIPTDQVEFISTPDRIKSVVASGSMTEIWEALEHGERVDCLDCIPGVSPLLYDSNPRTREIAAWWLRRRVFGVFGPGEVYSQTLTKLASDPDPVQRAYAANAVGEFLSSAGVTNLATAATKDADGGVRAAALAALSRINDEGAAAVGNKSAVSAAMADPDPRVKLAALSAAGRIKNFSDPSSVAPLVGDADPAVRRRAAEVIGTLHVKTTVASLVSVAKGDADPTVRAAACHTLGRLGDASAKADLTAIQQNDADGFVRDAAQIALLRL
jgi:HEAT repeat protein